MNPSKDNFTVQLCIPDTYTNIVAKGSSVMLNGKNIKLLEHWSESKAKLQEAEFHILFADASPTMCEAFVRSLLETSGKEPCPIQNLFVCGFLEEPNEENDDGTDIDDYQDYGLLFDSLPIHYIRLPLTLEEIFNECLKRIKETSYFSVNLRRVMSALDLYCELHGETDPHRAYKEMNKLHGSAGLRDRDEHNLANIAKKYQENKILQLEEMAKEVFRYQWKADLFYLIKAKTGGIQRKYFFIEDNPDAIRSTLETIAEATGDIFVVTTAESVKKVCRRLNEHAQGKNGDFRKKVKKLTNQRFTI